MNNQETTPRNFVSQILLQRTSNIENFWNALPKTVVIFLLSVLFVGCANKFQVGVQFDTSEPIRVAILPFEQIEDGKRVDEKFDTSLLVDNISLVSSRLLSSPATTMQGFVQAELEKTNLELVPPGFVLVQLGHHGFVREKMIHFPSLLTTKPKKLCELLQCDAVMYGTVTNWNRGYYGLQTVNQVGLNLKLVRASDDKVLYQAAAENSSGRGIGSVPTGFAPILLEPILGLDNDNLVGLGEAVVKDLVAPLRISTRPEFLKTPPPVIYGAIHNGVVDRVDGDHPLTVMLLGTGKLEAYFSIGMAVQQVPMFEVEDGHYVGKFLPLPTDQIEKESVTVHLRDKFGRTADRLITVPLRLREGSSARSLAQSR